MQLLAKQQGKTLRVISCKQQQILIGKIIYESSNHIFGADPNGNCVALDLGDVVTEIAAYRGTGTVSGCVDCPGSLRLGPGDKEKLPVIPSLKTKTKIKKGKLSE